MSIAHSFDSETLCLTGKLGTPTRALLRLDSRHPWQYAGCAHLEVRQRIADAGSPSEGQHHHAGTPRHKGFCVQLPVPEGLHMTQTTQLHRSAELLPRCSPALPGGLLGQPFAWAGGCVFCVLIVGVITG